MTARPPFTVTVLTMFPEAFPGPLGVSLIGTAWREKGLWSLETLATQTLRLAEDAGQQSHARLDHHHRRRLAAGEDRVSDGDLLEPARV